MDVRDASTGESVTVTGSGNSTGKGPMNTTPRMAGVTTPTILVNGTAVVVSTADYPLPATVWVRPAAGDTVALSYSCDGGTTYTAWSAGSVTAYTESVFDGPITHIKGQRTAGSGTTSAFGVC